MMAISPQFARAKQSPALHTYGELGVDVSTDSDDPVSNSPVSGELSDRRMFKFDRRTFALICLMILATILYLATMDTGLQPYELHGGDLITHQYAQVQARPGNAPGYPMYTMGGWLWFHLLRGSATLLGFAHPNPLPILSSYSTIWALLSLWLLFNILCITTASSERPRGNWPIAFMVAAFYAATFFFWYYATTTEQYSSAVAQTLAIVYVYLLWRDSTQHVDSLLFLLAFLSGLSLAHMVTVAFIVPPLVGVVLWQRPAILRRPRTVLLSIFFATLPLLSYSYVYARGARHPEWWGSGNWTSATSWFWSFVSTAQGREELLWGFEPGRAFLGNGFPELIVGELGLPILMASLIGIAFVQRRLSVLLYSTLAIYLAFNWAYRYGNWFQVILPAYPLLLIGTAAIANWWQYRPYFGSAPSPSARYLRALRYLPHALLAFAIVWRALGSLPEANSRDRLADTALQHAAILLDQPLPQGAKLFAAVDDALALQYLANIWQVRPDVEIINSREAATLLGSATPLFATWQSVPALVSELPSSLHPDWQSFGADWIVLHESPVTAATESLAYQASQPSTAAYQVTDVLSLVGYTVEPSPLGRPVNRPGQQSMDVVLYWHLDDAAWPEDLAISLRPTRHGEFVQGLDGNIIQVDRIRPIHGLLASQVDASLPAVIDGYRLPLTEPYPAGIDGLTVLLYASDPDGFHNVAELKLPIPE